MTFQQALRCLRWLPAYGYQRLTRRTPFDRPPHVIIAVADHFEPPYMPGASGPAVSFEEQERRLKRWCTEYPKMAAPWRDADGRPFRHTYFYAAEQYDKQLVERLANHCHGGWGEIEVHLHHGVAQPDTADNTQRLLVAFRDALAGHGCLSRADGDGPPRYAFVHGNWALANSAGNRFCGVDDEMQILADTGCFADFTLPSAPNRAQVDKINALYECALPLAHRAPHRRGRDLRAGRPPHTLPLIVQGPLGVRFVQRPGGWLFPRIENSELSHANPPTMDRFRLWRRVPISVSGRPDWIFIKLHCHGMDPRDEEAMFGAQIGRFLQELTEPASKERYRLHFTTAREMVNIIMAACDGREGNPGDYRDYRFRLITTPKAV